MKKKLKRYVSLEIANRSVDLLDTNTIYNCRNNLKYVLVNTVEKKSRSGFLPM